MNGTTARFAEDQSRSSQRHLKAGQGQEKQEGYMLFVLHANILHEYLNL